MLLYMNLHTKKNIKTMTRYSFPDVY